MVSFILRGLSAAALVACSVGIATGADLSSQPIRLVVPYSAGGPADSIAREVGQVIGQQLKTSVIVENQGGALGALALNNVIRAAPDGHTLFFAASGNITVNPLVNEGIAASVDKLVPIGVVSTQPHVLVISSKLPVKSVAELIAYAKANPGKVNFGSSGTGGLSHLGEERFKKLAGIDVVHIPYKGTSQAVTDLASGNIHAFFTSMPSLSGMLDSGSLRVIGATGPSKSPALKDVPLIDSTLPGFSYTTWYAIYAPLKTPNEVVMTLSQAVKAATIDPAIQAKLTPLGVDLEFATPEQLRAMGTSERENWRKVLAESGVSFK